MGCLSNRKKQTKELADQKWDHINLQDFKAKGCGAGFAYGYLWFSLLLSVVVYAVDSFTAVNLLVFNRWSSKIEPAISVDVSKWIFSACIILSFINLAYEGVRATRVIRRGNVAESYMDTLAARWQSIRLGQGQGWRRFLVFAELTKSKKGAEYVALFTYFSFQSWIRVLLCSAPRQVVNAFTLKSVYEVQLSANADNVGSAFVGFFDKLKSLAEEDYRQAAILSGMAFTFVVWVFSALFLLLAVCFYVFFLFHWIPRADGGLTGYCERKVNKKLLKIVTTKVTKALAKGQADRMKAEAKAAWKNGEKPQLERAATLPTLPNVEPIKEDSLPAMPALSRADTATTLPQYSSRPASPGSIEMRNMDQIRPAHMRAATGASSSSYSARAPLLNSAADMGYAPDSRTATLPDIDLSAVPPPHPATSNIQRNYGPRPPIASHVNMRSQTMDTNFGSDGPAQTIGYEALDDRAPTLPDVSMSVVPPLRSGTANSQRPFGDRPGVGTLTNHPSNNSLSNSMRDTPGPMDRPGVGGHTYMNSNSTLGRAMTESPAPMDNVGMGQGPPRNGTPVGGRMGSQESYFANGNNASSAAPAPKQYMPYNPNGQYGQAPPVATHTRGTPAPRQQTPINGYQPPPFRSATGTGAPRGPQYPPQRTMTAPVPPTGPGGYTGRPLTPQQSTARQGARGPPAQNYYGSDVPRQGDGYYQYDVESQNHSRY